MKEAQCHHDEALLRASRESNIKLNRDKLQLHLPELVSCILATGFQQQELSRVNHENNKGGTNREDTYSRGWVQEGAVPPPPS